MAAFFVASAPASALTFEQKQSKENPLFQCRVIVAVALEAFQHADVKLKTETDDEAYGLFIDLLAKYDIALLSTVLDNSDRKQTYEQTSQYIAMKMKSTFDTTDFDDLMTTFAYCHKNESKLTHEGLMLAEDIFGYGSSITMVSKTKDSLKKIYFK